MKNEQEKMNEIARKLAELLTTKEKDSHKLSLWLNSIIYNLTSGYETEYKIKELEKKYEAEKEYWERLEIEEEKRKNILDQV